MTVHPMRLHSKEKSSSFITNGNTKFENNYFTNCCFDFDQVKSIHVEMNFSINKMFRTVIFAL